MGKNLNGLFKQNRLDYDIVNISRRNGYDITKHGILDTAVKFHKPDVIIFAAANVGSMAYVSANAAEVAANRQDLSLDNFATLLKQELAATNGKSTRPMGFVH